VRVKKAASTRTQPQKQRLLNRRLVDSSRGAAPAILHRRRTGAPRWQSFLAPTANVHGAYFGKLPSTPSTYQFSRCSSGSVSVLPAGTFTSPA
jgi:hypothetical protein